MKPTDEEIEKEAWYAWDKSPFNHNDRDEDSALYREGFEDGYRAALRSLEKDF